MPYTRPYTGGFQDFPNTTTPINASALNTIDLGVKAANDQFQTVTTAQRATLTPSVGQAVWDSDLKQLMVFMNASGGNAWQPVGNRIVCASTTRPSSPFEGQEIYETDSQKTLVYSGSAWVETSDLDYSPSATVCTSSTRPTTGLFEGQRIYETDTNREFTYSGSGWVQTNQWSTTSGVTGVNNLIVPPTLRLERATTQSIANASDVFVTWPVEVFDTDGCYTATSDTITIQTAGVYQCNVGISFAANATGYRVVSLAKNPSAANDYAARFAATQVTNAGASSDVYLTISSIISANANDTIKVLVYQNSGGALNIGNATLTSSNSVSLAWIGRTS